MLLSRKQRLIALEQASNLLQQKSKPALVVIGTEAIRARQDEIAVARAEGRTLVLIYGTPYKVEPASLLTEVVEVGETDGSGNPRPDMSRIERPGWWG